MRTTPVTRSYTLSTDLSVFRRLERDTHGVLSATSDGSVIKLSIVGASTNGNIQSQVWYSVHTKDVASGANHAKVGIFPSSEEERANKLTYTVKPEDNGSAPFRIIGNCINERNQELIFSFSAYTDGKGWRVTVNDYVDHSIDGKDDIT